MSVRAAPTLTVLTVPSLDAVDMDMELVQQHHHHQQQQQTLLSPLSDGERSPKSRNALGLTLPGTRTPPTTFAHSIDAMLGDAKQEDMEMRKQHQQHHHHHSPPRRIIHEVEQLNNNNKNTLIMTAPVICEQGPSAPASPTTPSPASRSAKRPCPLSVDALQRLNLLSPNYMPTNGTMDAGGARMPPISPSYPTSDLGSSPRSSISTSHYSALGINASNWHVFRDAYARRRSSGGAGAMSGSGDLDCESEASAKIGGGGGGFLTPHQMLSPAPFSPFSDYGVADLHCTSVYGTPYSNRSPNLSPSPVRRAGENLHFSFEQTRSRSSLSNPTGSGGQDSSGGECHLRIPQSRALDMEARVRSRSEGEALGGTIKCRTDVTSMVADDDQQQQEEQDERMDTGEEQQQQQQHPLLVATSSSSSSTPQLHAGQKRRLLHKSRRTDEDDFRPNAGDVLLPADQRAKQLHTLISQPDSSIGAMPRGDTLISRQPTIEEPPPSPTLAELFQPRDLQLDKQRRRQVEDWIRQQTAALEAFRHSLIPTHQETNLLQVPMLVPQNSLEHLWPNPSAFNSCAGPIRPAASLWRRSRSESDVSAATAAAAAAAKVNAGNGTAVASGEGTLSSTTSPAPAHRRTSQQHAAPLLKTPLNEATHVCEHCGQGFSMHDRLAKHIASRHRDRSASMNDENSRVHKCALCPKSFGRSDMLTRHMRLHTGIRPYACQLCGQVFSRSDHLSTHQRTHTGEKPYQCPLCNYSASRRDMITRHMRTHLMPDGTPVPFTAAELTEIPPISKLSLNSAPTACHGGGSGAVTPHALATAEDTPPRLGTPVPPPTAPALAMMSSAREEQPAAATARIVPSVPPPPPPDPAPVAAFEPVQEQQRKHMEHMVAAAKLLSAAVTNGGQQQHHIGGFGTVHQAVQQQQQQPARGPSLEGLLNPQMMLSTLHAQIPTHLRRSSPNLFGVHDYPSAFRPPPPIQLNALHHQQPSSAMSPAAVALSSALSSVQQLLQHQHQHQQQQQQQRLAAMSAAAAAAVAAGGTAPFLFRQNSFGGLGFPGQQQQQQQKLDAAAQPSHQLQQKPK